jgi:hypothetical protein
LWLLAGAGTATVLVATFIALTSHHWVTLPLAAAAVVVTSLAGRHARWGDRWMVLPVLLVVVSCFALLVT